MHCTRVQIDAAEVLVMLLWFVKSHGKPPGVWFVVLKLTWYVSVTILEGVEVVHEFFNRNLECLKQASVFKEPVRDLKHSRSKCQESDNTSRYK